MDIECVLQEYNSREMVHTPEIPNLVTPLVCRHYAYPRKYYYSLLS